MTFPDLPHVLQLQKDLWRWPKSRASVMVGAGLSLNAEPLAGVTTQFPTWRQLARAMFDDLHPALPDESTEQKVERDTRFNGTNALRIASEYEAAFDRQKLDLLIREKNPDVDHQPGLLHNLLLRLPWTDVFTTNYDTLLERTEIPGRTYQPVTKATELTTAFAPRIVKLHGSFPSQTPFIISEEDYRTYPRKFAPFVNSVQQSLLENSFVLVGFSGDDPNFLQWTGWIRDELEGKHASIYLVGPLSLGNAERALLVRRGVTPIDLSPLFIGMHPTGGIHATSIEWFLRSLAAARPPRPEKWPELEKGSETAPYFNPPLVLGQKESPDPVDMSPDVRIPLTMEIVIKVTARWHFERLNYPGWIVADEQKRTNLWETTKYWINPLLSFSKNLRSEDRILIFREINWRLETSMVPLFTEWIEPFQQALDELFEGISTGRVNQPSIEIIQMIKISPIEVTEAWLAIAFGLLREARETYDIRRWEALKIKIDKVVPHYPQQNDRIHYEAALWAMWNVERKKAKIIIDSWQPSPKSPLAGMWKAGLLAELDELSEARTLLRRALSEIRKSLRSQGQNIELLSMEGWCTYLLCSVETVLDMPKIAPIREEFWERWQELKAWDCSPWPRKEYFDEVLSVPPPEPHKVERQEQGFDPGPTYVSHSWRSDMIGPYLPGFACIRLYEQVGIPMRLKMLNISGDSLKYACRWVAPFTGFWSPALLIRAGKMDALEKDEFLIRTRVAAMDSTLAKRLYMWCLEILERELADFSGSFVMGSGQESLFEILPEVLSRLAFKVDSDSLKKTFLLALRFHRLPGIRAHIRLHESSEPWFRRLFDAADGALLLEWLPELITAPLFDESVHSFFPSDHVWPDPMKHFPSHRGWKAKDERPDLVNKIKEATDWLIARAASESGEARYRALSRLIDVYKIKVMTADQERQFGELLWSKKLSNNLPDFPNFAVFGYLHFPSPPNIDVKALIRIHILSLPQQYFVSRDAQGRLSISGGRELPLIVETSLASKPIVQVRGEALGGVEWTLEESKELYFKALEWWKHDKEWLTVEKKQNEFGLIVINPIFNTLKILGDFLSRAVLPRMDWANEDQWKELIEWLQVIRDFNVFPTIALPYVLIKRPSEIVNINRIIYEDLVCDVDGAVAAAAKAIRHWVQIAATGHVTAPSPNLLTALIERIVFRRKSGVASCLLQLSYLLIDNPESVSTQQATLISNSLEQWHFATMIPVPNDNLGDFKETERPYLRMRLGQLAGALKIWYFKIDSNAPEPLPVAMWQKLCSSDPLPEVRRSFDTWSELD